MERQAAYRAEVIRIMDAGMARMCPIPRANAEMIAAAKFLEHCPHCGEPHKGQHHAECPTREM
jgi:hypothetical protein